MPPMSTDIPMKALDGLRAIAANLCQRFRVRVNDLDDDRGP